MKNRTAEGLEEFLRILHDGWQFPGIGIINHILHFHFRGGLFTGQNFVQLAAVFKLFHAIDRLESLTLWLPLSFPDLGEECCESLIALCHSPNLNAITIQDLFNIPKYLLLGSHIKHVTLSSTTFLTYPSDQPKSVYQPESITVHSAQFHSLLHALHTGGGGIEHPARFKEALARLKELNLTMDDILDVLSCLHTASLAHATLKEIKLNMIIWPNPGEDQSTLLKSTPTYPFHHLPNLRILRLGFHQPRLTKSGIKPVREFLEFSILPPSLEKLFLSVRLGLHTTVSEDGMFSLLEPGWNLLDAILTRSPFCAIPLVLLNLHYFVRLMVTPRCKLDDNTLIKCARESVLRDRLPRFSSPRPHKVVIDAEVLVDHV